MRIQNSYGVYHLSVGCARRCSPVCESRHDSLRLLDLLLGLDSPVEDRAVSTLAKDVLVEGSLAPLALHPQVAVLLFVQFEFLLALDVYLLHFTVAI